MKELEPKSENMYEKRVGLVYARVSSVGQASYGHGLDSQESRCIADLKSIRVPYDKSFLDSFTGGGDFMRRPAMRKLLEYIDANPHKTFLVVFDDISRFARDVEFHIKLRAAFRLRNVALRCLNYSFDESPEGEFAELVMAGNAQLARKQNRRQVIQKQKARMEAGHWALAARKGYSRNPVTRVLEPNKEGLEKLKPALEGFAVGNLQRKIDVCRFLVERGFWKGNQSPDRYVHRVDALLRDPFYCGDVEYLPWDVSRRKGQHDGIISPEMFERIQRRLKNRSATARVRKDISDEFPIRGLINCPACERSLTGANAKGRSRKYSYYYCQHRECSLYGTMLKKEDVEGDFRMLLLRNRLKADVGQVVDVVFNRVWNQEVGELEQQKRRSVRRKDELEAEIADLSLMARRAQSEAVQRAYEKQIERAATELEGISTGSSNLDVPYQTALSKISGLLKNPIEIWDAVDVLEKHRLFFFLFDEKLPYTKNEGYQTGDSLSTTRLFEEFASANPHFVDTMGKTSNRLKSYLARFWEYYESSSALRKSLESPLLSHVTVVTN